MLKHFTALFGNVALERGLCPICKEFSLIRNGKFIACDHEVKTKAKGFKRESEPVQARHRPGKKEQERILREQDYRCVYCDTQFGEVRHRGQQRIVIKLHWDHSLPFSFSQDNHSHNFVASCHVCNGIKSNKMFRDLDEIRIYLNGERKNKGYDF